MDMCGECPPMSDIHLTFTLAVSTVRFQRTAWAQWVITTSFGNKRGRDWSCRVGRGRRAYSKSIMSSAKPLKSGVTLHCCARRAALVSTFDTMYLYLYLSSASVFYIVNAGAGAGTPSLLDSITLYFSQCTVHMNIFVVVNKWKLQPSIIT